MVVQHNLLSINSNRMLGITKQRQTKLTEKLSSGYRINRAADDAAGLAISEKMRRQIRGLNQASENAEDGVSCVQTAEGALAEVHDMLQRMTELAVKGANGTLTTDDRKYITEEVRQLMQEIDRVSSTTTFNEQSLLDGSFDSKTLQVGAEADETIEISIGCISSNELMASAIAKGLTYQTSNNNPSCMANDEKVTSDSYGKHIYWHAVDYVNSAAEPANGTVPVFNEGDTIHTHLLSAQDLTIFHEFDYDSIQDDDTKNKIQNGRYAALNSAEPEERYFKALIVFAKSAVSDVSKLRSDMGAVQNRLEHTINNLDNVSENTASAESQLRDTDMAAYMVEYSNADIIAQAGQAMLAQANQQNQGVLSLLA